MAYCTQEDIEKKIPAAKLVELTDDTGAGEVGETGVAIIAEAVAEADAVIDSYCGHRYTVPFASESVPDIVRLFSIRLSVYELYSRRPDGGIPDSVADNYDKTIDHLNRISLGRAQVGGPVKTDDRGLPKAVTPADSSGDEDEAVFTREALENM